MRIGDLEAIETVDQTVARILKIKNHGNDRFESYHRRKDGTVFPVEVSTQYLQADDGRYVVFIRDITDRKRLEKNLYDQRRRLESIIEGERVGTWEWNVQTGETVFNEAWAQIIGYTLEELAPISIQTWERFAHPDDLRESDLLLERHFSGVLPYYESECRMRHKDGHWVWVIDRGRVLTRSEDGKPLMMFGTHAEVTERKREEENLRVAKGFSESIIEHAAEGVCVCHNIQQYPYVRFTVWNRRMQEITGYSMAEINRLGWYQTIYSDPVIREQVQERMERMRTGDDLHNEGWEITRSDGQKRFLEINTTILPSHDGQTHVLALMHDITEHKRAEQKLAQEAIRRRILIEQSRDGIVVLDQNGKVYEANQRYAEMLGYTAEEVRELYVWNWDLQWSSDELLEMIRLVDPAGDHFETRHRRKDGTSFDVGVSTNGAVIEGQKLIFCVCRDITERKKAEEKLRASEEKYRGIFDCSIAAIYLFDQDKHFIDSNQAGLDLLGYSREELLQMSIPDVDADPVVVLPAHSELLSGRRLINCEHELRRKDQSIITVLNNSIPLTESNGNVIGMLSTLLDITERKQAENKIKASETFIRDVIDSLSSSLAVLDQHGTIIDVNASWKRHATDNGCLDRNFYMGTNYLDVCEKAAATGLGIELMEIAGGIRSVIDRSESSYGREYFCQTPSGDLWSRMKAFPLNTPEAGAVIIHDDITAQKRAESSILNALEEKQVLLQEIHHRVKNNLQVVIGLLGLQTGQLKNPTVKEALQVSQQRIKIMAMIHETLHQGQNLAAVSLAGFLMKLTQQLKNAYNQHANILVTVEAEEIVLKMDQAIPCGLIVNELVTNALKYAFPGNASGQVHIKASRIDGSRIELKVTDNGIGLPPSVDLTRPSSLGLQMVRGLVEHQLSGSFYASVSGGTTFVMRWAL